MSEQFNRAINPAPDNYLLGLQPCRADKITRAVATDGGKWQGATAAGATDVRSGVVHIPVGNDSASRLVRYHEALHAQHTPATFRPRDLCDQALEDARLHRHLSKASTSSYPQARRDELNMALRDLRGILRFASAGKANATSSLCALRAMAILTAGDMKPAHARLLRRTLDALGPDTLKQFAKALHTLAASDGNQRKGEWRKARNLVRRFFGKDFKPEPPPPPPPMPAPSDEPEPDEPEESSEDSGESERENEKESDKPTDTDSDSDESEPEPDESSSDESKPDKPKPDSESEDSDGDGASSESESDTSEESEESEESGDDGDGASSESESDTSEESETDAGDSDTESEESESDTETEDTGTDSGSSGSGSSDESSEGEAGDSEANDDSGVLDEILEAESSPDSSDEGTPDVEALAPLVDDMKPRTVAIAPDEYTADLTPKCDSDKYADLAANFPLRLFIRRPDMTVNRVKLAIGRRATTPTRTGARILQRKLVPAITTPGTRLFGRDVANGQGGTVLIDASGSMRIPEQTLIEFLDKAPALTVACYNAPCDYYFMPAERMRELLKAKVLDKIDGPYGTSSKHDIFIHDIFIMDETLARKHLTNYDVLGNHGNIYIYAANGYRADFRRDHPSTLWPHEWRGGGNLVDYQAMAWLIKQPEPRYIVTDCQFTGPWATAAHDLCQKLVASKAITVVPDLGTMQEILVRKH